MTVLVNPPPLLKIPLKFFEDPEIRVYFEQERQILFQLWNRTGGASDNVSGYEVVEVVGDIELAQFRLILAVTADTAPITITLPQISIENISQSIIVVILDATFDTTVITNDPATVSILGDTSVLMDDQYMALDYTAISQILWNPT